MREERHHDVVIVGGGPVGHGLAIELGQRGLDVAVVERFAQVQPIPKGQNLTQRSMEHFRAWGCEQELRAARTVPRGHGIGGLVCYGNLLSDWSYDWLQRELVRPYYFTDNERLPQYETERVLRARAAEFPNIRLIYGQSGVGLQQDDAGIIVEIMDADGNRSSLHANWLVGCDGSRSMVRQAAGITETRRDHDKKMVLLVFRSEELHELLERYPDKQFYNALHPDLEGYWMFFGRVDLGSTWFFHAPVPLETTEENFDFAAYLHRAVGEEFPVELQYVGFWDLRFALADTYQAGRMFIAGDAAHSHPPYGGYGINTGFEDVRNLGWKLAAAQQGWAGPALLDSYDAERRPVFASTAREFIENVIEEDRRFLATFDPNKDRAAFEVAWKRRAQGAPEVNAFEPNYEGSPVVPGSSGNPGAKGSHVFEARAGHHLPPRELSNGQNIFEVLGTGFSLIALDVEDAAVSAFEEAARERNIPLDVIRDDAGGESGDWKARLILVRPDDYIAWVGNDATDAAAVMRSAVGQE